MSNTSPTQPESFFSDTPYNLLMQKRIRKVLVVCSPYDFYMLEEDGRIDEHIFNEYVSLNLRYPPIFIHAPTATDALQILEKEEVDLIIEMLSTGEIDAFNLAKQLKSTYSNTPVVVLTHFSREVSVRLVNEDLSAVDYVFCWLGNPDIFLAIIKLIEDRMNAEHDILNAGVQSVLLVEDSIRYISSYLPYLYRIILEQSNLFSREALNEHQQMLRRRGRPKILLAKNFNEATKAYKKYRGHIQGIISDVSYKSSPKQRDNKAKAGIKLCNWIKKSDPNIPVLLQSSDIQNEALAIKQHAGFIYKYSKNILNELKEYILKNFGFGDFEFLDPNSGQIISVSKDLRTLQEQILTVPDKVIEYHTQNDDFSKWLNARALFPIAKKFKALHRNDFANTGEIRKYIHNSISHFREYHGKGIIAEFNRKQFDDYVHFSRIGQGSLGGKARGLAFMASVLKTKKLANKYANVRISIPPTIVLTTEVFDEFMQQNNLYRLVHNTSGDNDILKQFIASELPQKVKDDLKSLALVTTSPLAIRSSSRLEDSLFQPFAGIYNTYMLPPHPDPAITTIQLEQAIKSVYASVFFQQSRKYMAATSNLIDEEKMAVIIQSVCGSTHNGYFYPTLSGVARSLNYYTVGKEKTDEGIVELAFGLGKQIVDGATSLRFSPRHPKKIIQLSTPQQALKETQKYFYAIDLNPESFHPDTNEKVNLAHHPIKHAENYPAFHYAASTYDLHNHILRDGDHDGGKKLITFSNILNHNTFPLANILTDLLAISSEALNSPVEIEFAANLNTLPGEPAEFNYLQVRPIMDMDKSKYFDIESIPEDKTVLRSSKSMGHGITNNIRDIVYVKTASFNPSNTKKIARELSNLNTKFKVQNTTFILIGPGRWGSTDPWLGIPVKWSDISQSQVIVEIGIAGYHVEPSQGTHFFHNLTSLGVSYLYLAPYLKNGYLNENLLNQGTIITESDLILHYQFQTPLTVIINGRKSEGVIIR